MQALLPLVSFPERLLCFAACFCSVRSQSALKAVVSTTGMHARVSSCRCVVARSLLHAPVSASRGMRRVTSTQRRFLLVIWFMLGFREGLVLRSPTGLGLSNQHTLVLYALPLVLWIFSLEPRSMLLPPCLHSCCVKTEACTARSRNALLFCVRLTAHASKSDCC